MSDINKEFWKNININLIKKEIITKKDKIELSYSDLQEEVVNFFINDNDIYLDLLKFIGKNMEKKKNGN